MKSLYFTFICICVCCLSTANAQSGLLMKNDEIVKSPEIRQSSVREIIRIPNIQGYYTLKCDFHIHTVFSDGEVWPSVRAQEAWQQGLDAIAITDHLEHRPRKAILTGDHNESYKIAKKQGDDMGLIVIQGAEITRRKPFGHMNALFITDANQLDTKDSLKALDIAIKQGGFILWNHPGWPDNKSTLYPIHEQLVKEKKIHGVEVFNYSEYYPVCFDWCRNMNLAFMGNSDIHEITADAYTNQIRPMTLVFAKERSVEGIKQALFARRSVAYFDGILAGPQEFLLALLESSFDIKVVNKEKRRVSVSNNSDIDYKMVNDNTMYILPAGKTVMLTIPKTGDFKVINCFTGAKENLQISVNDIESVVGLK